MGVNSLYLNGAGSASLDIREDCRIIGISLSTDQAGSAGGVEVSFMSTASTTVNDTTGVLAGFIAGSAVANPTHMFVAMDEPASAGERIYLHNVPANKSRAFIYTTAPGTKASTRRR